MGIPFNYGMMVSHWVFRSWHFEAMFCPHLQRLGFLRRMESWRKRKAKKGSTRSCITISIVEDHLLSAFCNFLFSMFSASVHIWRPCPPSTTCWHIFHSHDWTLLLWHVCFKCFSLCASTCKISEEVLLV